MSIFESILCIFRLLCRIIIIWTVDSLFPLSSRRWRLGDDDFVPCESWKSCVNLPNLAKRKMFYTPRKHKHTLSSTRWQRCNKQVHLWCSCFGSGCAWDYKLDIRNSRSYAWTPRRETKTRTWRKRSQLITVLHLCWHCVALVHVALPTRNQVGDSDWLSYFRSSQFKPANLRWSIFSTSLYRPVVRSDHFPRVPVAEVKFRDSPQLRHREGFRRKPLRCFGGYIPLRDHPTRYWRFSSNVLYLSHVGSSLCWTETRTHIISIAIDWLGRPSTTGKSKTWIRKIEISRSSFKRTCEYFKAILMTLIAPPGYYNYCLYFTDRFSSPYNAEIVFILRWWSLSYNFAGWRKFQYARSLFKICWKQPAPSSNKTYLNKCSYQLRVV